MDAFLSWKLAVVWAAVYERAPEMVEAVVAEAEGWVKHHEKYKLDWPDRRSMRSENLRHGTAQLAWVFGDLLEEIGCGVTTEYGEQIPPKWLVLRQLNQFVSPPLPRDIAEAIRRRQGARGRTRPVMVDGDDDIPF